MEEGDEGEGDQRGDRMQGDDALDPEPSERRGEERGHDGLADPAETDARDRDPELRRRDRIVEAFDRVRGRLRAAAAFGDPDVDLAAADGDQRELGGDEIAVREDEDEDGHEAEQVGAERVRGHRLFDRWTRHALPRVAVVDREYDESAVEAHAPRRMGRSRRAAAIPEKTKAPVTCW